MLRRYPPFAVPLYAYVGANDGWWHTPQRSPRNADCRGGVFAVFAKISPPIPHYTRKPHTETHGFYRGAGREGMPRWLGRALAALGTAPTKSAIANLEN